MHTDPVLVIASEAHRAHAALELDDGATVTLNPGDTVVQNGTRHRWHNPGTVPAVVVAVLIGANRT